MPKPGVRQRGRHFAMIPCDIKKWAGWPQLTIAEQWAYQLLRRQKDLTQAGVLPLRLERWASECDEAGVETLRNLILSLAVKDYIVIDFEAGEVLLCWFITTDHVYMKPNSLEAAVTAIDDVASPGIKTALHNELKKLDESGEVPVPREATVRWLIGQLESFALIGSRQPLYTPSTRPPQPVNTESARRAQSEQADSGSAVLAVAGGPEADGESGQRHLIIGHNNPCAQVASLTSVPVVGNELDVKPKTENDMSPADAGDPPPRFQPIVHELCNLLADEVVSNGAPGTKRPRVTVDWLNQCRLMIEKDGRDPEKIRKCILWCQGHHFWFKNVRCMDKLREQYDRLQADAMAEQRDRDRGGQGAPPRPAVGAARVQQGERAKESLRRRIAAQEARQ